MGSNNSNKTVRVVVDCSKVKETPGQENLSLLHNLPAPDKTQWEKDIGRGGVYVYDSDNSKSYHLADMKSFNDTEMLSKSQKAYLERIGHQGFLGGGIGLNALNNTKESFADENTVPIIMNGNVISDAMRTVVVGTSGESKMVNTMSYNISDMGDTSAQLAKCSTSVIVDSSRLPDDFDLEKTQSVNVPAYLVFEGSPDLAAIFAKNYEGAVVDDPKIIQSVTKDIATAREAKLSTLSTEELIDVVKKRDQNPENTNEVLKHFAQSPGRLLDIAQKNILRANGLLELMEEQNISIAPEIQRELIHNKSLIMNSHTIHISSEQLEVMGNKDPEKYVKDAKNDFFKKIDPTMEQARNIGQTLKRLLGKTKKMSSNTFEPISPDPTPSPTTPNVGSNPSSPKNERFF